MGISNGNGINWLVPASTGKGQVVKPELFKRALLGSRSTALTLIGRQVGEYGPLILRDLFIRRRGLDDQGKAQLILDQDLRDIAEEIAAQPNLLRDCFFEVFSKTIYHEGKATEKVNYLYKGRPQMAELHDLALVFKGILESIAYIVEPEKSGPVITDIIQRAYEEWDEGQESDDEFFFFLNTVRFLPGVAFSAVDPKTNAKMLFLLEINNEHRNKPIISGLSEENAKRMSTYYREMISQHEMKEDALLRNAEAIAKAEQQRRTQLVKEKAPTQKPAEPVKVDEWEDK